MKACNSSFIEIEEAIKAGHCAILPIGSCEQHGPHLPLTTDINLAEFISEHVSQHTNAVIFPSLNFGYSWVWKGIAGTMTLTQNTFKQVLHELVESIIQMGFKKIVLINGHDSNKMAIKYVLRDLVDKGYKEQKFYNIFYPNIQKIYSEYMDTPTWYGMFHADEFETSLMLAYDESLVDMTKAQREYPEKPLYYGVNESTLAQVSHSGIFGDATVATKNKGEAMLEDFVKEIVQLIK